MALVSLTFLSGPQSLRAGSEPLGCHRCRTAIPDDRGDAFTIGGGITAMHPIVDADAEEETLMREDAEQWHIETLSITFAASSIRVSNEPDFV